jgi:hypothetical protein
VPQTRGQVTVSILPQMTITSVQFTNSYALAKDDGHTNPPTAVETTVWRSSCPSPPCMARSAFQQGTAIRANITYALSYAPTSALTGVRVEGSMGSLGTLTASNVTIPAGTTTGIINVVSDTALPAGTQIYDLLSIGWGAGFFDSGNLPCSQFTCEPIGTSASMVYVTMATPPFSNLPLPLTTLALAVGSGGATTTAAAFQNTWATFSANGAGPVNPMTWDERPLSYYPKNFGFRDCATSSYLLLNVDNGVGACGSFAHLLQDALAVNGIPMGYVTITDAINSENFMIRAWTFLASDPTYAPYDWPVTLGLECAMPPSCTSGYYPGMVPLPANSIFGQVQSTPGIPGQNSDTPSEKIYPNHQILKDISGVSGAGPYFDPPYGVTYLNACDPQHGFESKAVAGYTAQILGVDLPGSVNFHARIKDPNNCPMQFSQ